MGAGHEDLVENHRPPEQGRQDGHIEPHFLQGEEDFLSFPLADDHPAQAYRQGGGIERQPFHGHRPVQDVAELLDQQGFGQGGNEKER